MTVEIISQSISTEVWDRAGIELATPGSAVRLASVARHVTDCARPLGPSASNRNLHQMVIFTHQFKHMFGPWVLKRTVSLRRFF